MSSPGTIVDALIPRTAGDTEDYSIILVQVDDQQVFSV